MSLIKQLFAKKACKIIPQDLAHIQRLADKKVKNEISNWFEEMQPFNEQAPKYIYIFFI